MRSAEVRARAALVRALQRALSLGVCMSTLCGLRFTDFGRVAFSDKATKQSRDLSVCLCFSLLNINNISKSKQKGCFVSCDS